MSLTYSTLVTALGGLLQYPISDPASATPSTNSDFNNYLPRIIDGAEQKIYRAMDFLATRTTDGSGSFTPGNRAIAVPATLLVIEGLAAITPAATAPDAGERVALRRTSLDMLDSLWPRASVTGVPSHYALKSATEIVVSPTPAAAYRAEFTGIFRPAPLSSTNTTTYISTTYPDLLLAACMVEGTGFQRDFGAQASDPKMALSWSRDYDERLASAMAEEQRRKGQGTNWSPFSPAPLSSPQRP